MYLSANFYACILIGLFVMCKIIHINNKIKNLAGARADDNNKNIVLNHTDKERYIINEVFGLLIIIFFWIIMQLDHFNFL
jgi:hypothetical protein